MAESLHELRARARKAGVKGYRGMDRSELEDALTKSGGGKSKSVVKKKKSKAKDAPKAKAEAKPERKQNRGGKSKPKATPKRDSEGGRNPIGSLDFSQTEGWNPRAGGDREMIFKAIKKARGNRDKAFDALKGSISRLVPAKTRTGHKRTATERQAYLRFLINRVIFDFARQTGQHEPSQNRVKYGTGGTGEGKFKRNSKPKAKASGSKGGKSKAKSGAKKSKGGKKSKKKS